MYVFYRKEKYAIQIRYVIDFAEFRCQTFEPDRVAAENNWRLFGFLQ